MPRSTNREHLTGKERKFLSMPKVIGVQEARYLLLLKTMSKKDGLMLTGIENLKRELLDVFGL